MPEIKQKEMENIELQEVPESEVASLENHLNTIVPKKLEDEKLLNEHSDKKLAQMMSDDCMKDFKAVLFPEDLSAGVKGDETKPKATSETEIEISDSCERTDSVTVTSIIEKVCQEVNGNFETKSDTNEAEQPSSSGSLASMSYLCQLCNLPFATEERFHHHKCRLQKDQQLKLNNDDEQAAVSAEPLNNNISKSTKPEKPKPFSCGLCNKRVMTSDSLKQHMKTHTDERPYPCSVCQKYFRSVGNLNAHMRTHTDERPFKCTFCEKRFNQSGNLHTHMSLHLNEKRFQCPTCEKCFSQGGSLRNHMKIHSGERPHVCPECDKTFVRKSHLDAHMRIHTGEKPYICSVCSRGFTQSGDLQAHMRLHTGDLPFVCQECGKGYSAKSNLTKHMRVHSEERPFECSVCGKAYNAKSTLVSHMRLHTGDRPYGCPECERRFFSSSHVKKHIRVHHPHIVVETRKNPVLIQLSNDVEAEGQSVPMLLESSEDINLTAEEQGVPVLYESSEVTNDGTKDTLS